MAYKVGKAGKAGKGAVGGAPKGGGKRSFEAVADGLLLLLRPRFGFACPVHSVRLSGLVTRAKARREKATAERLCAGLRANVTNAAKLATKPPTAQVLLE